MNPLFNILGAGNNGQSNLIQQLLNFKRSFRGDPRQQIQQMLNSGQISQQQYNNAVQMANQISQLFK